ncbi:hypothetical protein LPICM02_220062 [Pseudolactococcus piscium]|nr:hypothetical protein LPICM02_220062 [Lactococcus piscium]
MSPISISDIMPDKDNDCIMKQFVYAYLYFIRIFCKMRLFQL